MWLLYAFGSAFFAGVTAILAKNGIRQTDSNVATAIRTIIVLVFAWLLVFILGLQREIRSIDALTFVFLILSGLATGASWLCYFRALQLGSVNKVVPVDKASIVLTVILASMFLGEEITLIRAAGILLIAMGTYAMVEKKPEAGDTETPQSYKWLFYAVFAAVFASLTAILGKLGISGVNSNLGTAIRTIVVLLMAWFFVFVTGKYRTLRRLNMHDLFYICLSGIATGISWLCYYKALQDGPAILVVPIDKLSIVVTVLFSVFIFHEKLSRKALIGLIALVAGTLLLLV